jgi:two-component system NtrC family response regulator/two-component system response regulator HydG
MRKYARANAKEVEGLSDEVLTMLLRHRWPGNVRELENAMERAVVLCDEPILTPAYFPTLRAPAGESEPHAKPGNGVSIPGSTLAEIEREAILRTLEAVGGSTSRAASLLQISARKIQYKLKEYHQSGVLVSHD